MFMLSKIKILLISNQHFISYITCSMAWLYRLFKYEDQTRYVGEYRKPNNKFYHKETHFNIKTNKETKTLGAQTKSILELSWGQGRPDFSTLFTGQTFILELKAKDIVNDYFLNIKHCKKWHFPFSFIF